MQFLSHDKTCTFKLLVTRFTFARTGSQHNDFEDILGDDKEFLSAVSGDLEGNTSDEVGAICIFTC